MTATKPMRVRVDRERCQGHARCFALAPELFELDELGNGRERGDGTVAAELEERRGSPKPTVPNSPSRSSRNEGGKMSNRPPATDWSTDFDQLDPRWSENPYPIWDELRQTCPIAHTNRFMGVLLSRAATRTSRRRIRHRAFLLAPHRRARDGRMPLLRRRRSPPIRRSIGRPSSCCCRHSRPKRSAGRGAHARHLPQPRRPDCAAERAATPPVDYAQEIPVRVIAHMLGVPEEDGDLFRKWIKEILEIGITDRRLLRAPAKNDRVFRREDRRAAREPAR